MMGIDYGSKRVGVALTDESGSVAFPKATFPNDKALVRNISSLINEMSVKEVIVGQSLDNAGKDNDIAPKARAFAEELKRTLSVTIHYEPEYYTSQEARVHTGLRTVDAEAAAIILNSYITKSTHGDIH
jgi:putative Holliday junction resolvase